MLNITDFSVTYHHNMNNCFSVNLHVQTAFEVSTYTAMVKELTSAYNDEARYKESWTHSSFLDPSRLRQTSIYRWGKSMKYVKRGKPCRA